MGQELGQLASISPFKTSFRFKAKNTNIRWISRVVGRPLLPAHSSMQYQKIPYLLSKLWKAGFSIQHGTLGVHSLDLAFMVPFCPLL